MFPGDVGEIQGADWDRLQGVIARFEIAWARGERPKIDDYLPAGEPHREVLLLELIHAELEFRLKAGESARVEDYLRRHPGVLPDREAVLGLIRAEWNLRRRREPKLTLERFRSRFPEFADELDSARASTLATPIGSGRPAARPPAAAEAPLPRRLGKFELRQRVGAGSFGVVYRAWDTVMNREVALKLPRPEAVAAPSDLRAFLREARNAKDLRHPNIVEILDAGPIEGTVCVVRAFVEGTTLAERLKESSFSPEEAASLMALVAEALDHAHGRGIIHRDLKPSNILLDREGRPHISDFGLAKRESGDTTLSPAGAIGTIIGTPAYMSPEQSRGEAHDVDPRSDVYSAGVVLYEALTGSIPFRGRGRMLQVQIQGAEPAPPRSLNDDVPRDLETICLRAMAKAPSARYPTARAMADDLENFLQGQPVGPRPDGGRRPSRGPRPRSLIAGVGGVLAGLALAATIAAVAGVHRADHVGPIDRAIRGFERLEGLPYAPGLDGPEAHRRALDAIHEESAAWLRSVASEQIPGLRDRLVGSFIRLADRESSLGPDREAAGLWAQAVELAEAAASQAPADPPRLEALARALSGLAEVRGRLGAAEASTRLLDRALGLREKLRESSRRRAEERPDDVDALLGWAEAEVEALGVGLRLGRGADFAEAERLVGKVARQSPPGPEQRRRLARLYLALARHQLEAHQPAKARQAAHRGIRLREEAPSEPGAAADLAHFRLIDASASRQLGRIPEALDDFRRASERFESLALEDPIAVDFRRPLAASSLEIGRILTEQPGRLAEAIATLRRSLEIRQSIRRSHPQSHAELAALAETREALARALRREGRPVASAVNDFQAIACGVGAVVLAPGVDSYRRDLIRHIDVLAGRARSPLGVRGDRARKRPAEAAGVP